MDLFLHFERLDEDLFPELRFGPGSKGIRAVVPVPPGDARIPAAGEAKVLLVVFRLDEPALPPFPAAGRPGWQLLFDLPQRDGTNQHHVVTVAQKARDGNFSQRPTPDPHRPPLAGAIYRGAWWADLAPLFAQRLLRPGLAIEVAFAGQARVRLVLP